MSRGRFLSVLLVVLVTAWGSGCSCDGGNAVRPVDDGPVPIDGTPVVLITIDTLRADRVGVFAPDDPYLHTPNLDALANRGTFYPHCYTVAPLTLPAHASIMTGRYPTAHKIRDNVNYRLAYEETTIAEALRDAGYATAAFVSAETTHGSTGLSQGFDVYDDEIALQMQAGFTLIERRGDQTMDCALAWLTDRFDKARAGTDETARQPFFLWVHLFDPHYPYAPTEDLRPESMRRPADIEPGMLPEAVAVARARARYDAEVTFADAQVGRLLKAIDDAGLTEKSLIVATSDHGEALGDHGEETHGYTAYPSTIRVPLIVAGGGYEPDPDYKGSRCDLPHSVTAIAPTVALVTGVDAGLPAQSRCLAGYGQRASDDRSGWRVGATDRPVTAMWTPYFEAFLGTLAFGWAPVRGLVDGYTSANVKLEDDPLYLVWSNPPEAYFYPGMMGSISDDQWPRPEAEDGRQQAEADLRHLLRTNGTPPLGFPVVPPRTAIGGGIDQAAYPGAGAQIGDGEHTPTDSVLATTFPAQLFDESLDAPEIITRPSPKERIHILQGYQRAQRLASGGKYPLARKVLGELLTQSEFGDPERAPILLLLTECWRLDAEEQLRAGQPREMVLAMYGSAADAYREYVALMLAAGHSQSPAVRRDLCEMLAIREFFAGRYEATDRILAEWTLHELHPRGRLVAALAQHYRGRTAFAALGLADADPGSELARLRELLTGHDAPRDPAELNRQFGFP